MEVKIVQVNNLCESMVSAGLAMQENYDANTYFEEVNKLKTCIKVHHCYTTNAVLHRYL